MKKKLFLLMLGSAMVIQAGFFDKVSRLIRDEEREVIPRGYVEWSGALYSDELLKKLFLPALWLGQALNGFTLPPFSPLDMKNARQAREYVKFIPLFKDYFDLYTPSYKMLKSEVKIALSTLSNYTPDYPQVLLKEDAYSYNKGSIGSFYTSCFELKAVLNKDIFENSTLSPYTFYEYIEQQLPSESVATINPISHYIKKDLYDLVLIYRDYLKAVYDYIDWAYRRKHEFIGVEKTFDFSTLKDSLKRMKKSGVIKSFDVNKEFNAIKKLLNALDGFIPQQEPDSFKWKELSKKS